MMYELEFVVIFIDEKSQTSTNRLLSSTCSGEGNWEEKPFEPALSHHTANYGKKTKVNLSHDRPPYANFP